MMMDELKKLRQHLLTGVSYAIPFVACGGILICRGACVRAAGKRLRT
jgi:fructose-specific phosphotransferase system IIC component